jgi:soluble lytic murein transglycosylase-like protein
MSRFEQARDDDNVTPDRSLRLWPFSSGSCATRGPRLLKLRHGVSWGSIAVLSLALLLLSVVLLDQARLRQLDARNQRESAAVARLERKVQKLQAGIAFDSARRRLLLGMRNHILEANPRVSLAEAWRYAELALTASDKYPSVDPLFLLAVGIVESGYDSEARSSAGACGLYQIWPSTGRLLARSLGWTWDHSILYDPEKNTEAAALYLDMLFSTYNDPRLVLAEYNGGPLNVRYFRASAAALSVETRRYVPRVIELYDRFREELATGMDTAPDPSHGSRERFGKTLGEEEGSSASRARAGAPHLDRADG